MTSVAMGSPLLPEKLPMWFSKRGGAREAKCGSIGILDTEEFNIIFTLRKPRILCTSQLRVVKANLSDSDTSEAENLDSFYFHLKPAENLDSFCFHLKPAENLDSFCFHLKQAENLDSLLKKTPSEPPKSMDDGRRRRLESLLGATFFCHLDSLGNDVFTPQGEVSFITAVLPRHKGVYGRHLQTPGPYIFSPTTLLEHVWGLQKYIYDEHKWHSLPRYENVYRAYPPRRTRHIGFPPIVLREHVYVVIRSAANTENVILGGISLLVVGVAPGSLLPCYESRHRWFFDLLQTMRT
ncbi:hypothetical protein M5K25_024898 [Dendrobium thyrsiflorum]|uniref:Uncharacterized protein n=1 Tax=Dendrobium thyrsiflorum TaxID=117978 RepID=A0ABD0U3A1_DENTH